MLAEIFYRHIFHHFQNDMVVINSILLSDVSQKKKLPDNKKYANWFCRCTGKYKALHQCTDLASSVCTLEALDFYFRVDCNYDSDI